MVRKLVKPDLRRVEAHLVPVLEWFPQVVGAYLFGSSLESWRPESDVDVGLVLSANNLTDAEIDMLVGDIALAVGRPANRTVDLVVLNRCGIVFAFRVLSHGKLFFVRDADALGEFIERVSRAYGEIYPRYREALEAVAKGK